MSTLARIRRRRRQGGITLLELIVAIAIFSMVSLLIYGAFDSMNRGKKGEAMRMERSRQGREAVLRMVREISSAYLSMHNPANNSLLTRTTAFIGINGIPFDRLDFVSFAHLRIVKDVPESDQAEIGYAVVRDPDVDGKMDLVRREQSPPDLEPKKGGVVNVLAENVETFDLQYLDPTTGRWVETWDTTQGATGQPNRLPLEVRITLGMKAVPGVPASTFTTKFLMPMQAPLSFGIPQP